MKIYLYKSAVVDRDGQEAPAHLALEQVMARVGRMEVAEREQPVLDHTMLLEETARSRQHGWVSADFTLRRLSGGPGLSQAGQLTTDFELAEGDGFGEQTAICYAPATQRVAVQYNHHGPRAQRIASYLSGMLRQMDGGEAFNVQWTPVLAARTMARLKRGRVYKEVTVAINTERLPDSFAAAEAQNVALELALASREANQAGVVRVQLTRQRGGGLRNIMPFVNRLLDQPPDVVRSLKVRFSGAEQEEETLDLLDAREVAEVDSSQLQRTPGRRYTFASRRQAMEEEMGRWQTLR